MRVYILEKWNCLDWIETDDSYFAYEFVNAYNEKGFYSFLQENNLEYISGSDTIKDKIGLTLYRVTEKYL